MKIYTKTGDKGTTGLFGGKRVSKDDIRIEAYGTLDEVNSFLGQLNASFEIKEYNLLLLKVQNRLFDMGSHLASDPEKNVLPSGIGEEDIYELEKAMDNMESFLPPLKNFILPGGHPVVAMAHICRTVCRRAERRVISLHSISPADENIIRFLNRLSDFLFVFSRFLSFQFNVPEVIWSSGSKN
ncbi:MAG: cob(I)yrinic acid a,c-diamide adenosyltransferase [Saprospiraceae bacterium]|nr:cob(I)yrinic acid a,c-diamide adenosyltransferase [Saprospiraceae bacterium]MBK6565697.1 cob(I)yrinic acid a,c-diamide adenosyltransferase [Saprospiraceae bacterium]MBK6784659.1 cob(I)yrinic acid a,c-diamide adenosyltransferase [Saprospiraceae bacterium]MBK7525271.1 cob(I)yrinic acid a,c-diamide adenosyltransferase [Saprospiraceae bacterium]MBK8370290.1 cob(I)yrinic acid a,c-diamide adenosyltransferase [Saprospiraceae bacterium]